MMACTIPFHFAVGFVLLEGSVHVFGGVGRKSHQWCSGCMRDSLVGLGLQKEISVK